jgi:hypothetical protein
MTTFHIVPYGGRALWVLMAVVFAVIAIGGAMLAISARGARSSRFEVSADGLRLVGDLYGRTIPARDLRGAGIRVVDLGSERELAPASRTMGTALPGYRAGWFRLRNGEKALLYVTDTHRVVYVPTRMGYAVLLSAADPDSLVAALRAVAPEG